MRIAVKLLFAGERKVCDQIFEGFDPLRDQCFAEVTASSVSVLLSFGEAIARSKSSPEKLFVLLDMYEIMRELHSEIESLFKGKACSEIRESALGLTKRLAQEAVEEDATKTAVLDGTVHPLTSYVINFVKFLFDYQSTLRQLFQEFEKGEETSSQLASVTMRIMQALQNNLDGKSKQYKDASLKLFLMNNIHYMVRSVRRSEAKDLLGDDWVQRHRRIVQQHANQYNGPRFKTFNIQFEELHQKQSQWTVPDTELRESLRLAVAEVLLPAYRPLVDSWKAPQKYIRYTAEVLERMLGEFFEGKTLHDGFKILTVDSKYFNGFCLWPNVRHIARHFSIQLMPRRLSCPLLPLLPHLLLPSFSRPINPITISSSSTRLLVPGSRMDHQSSDKEKESDQMRECCGKGACEFNAERNRVSDRLMPHILNLYGSRATARDFDIYAADASFEDPLMCARGVKQIKSAFYSLSKVFSESSIVEYNIKEKMESQGKYEILIDNKQSYKFMGRYIDMISLIQLHVVDGKVIRHEDRWDKKPLKNRDTVDFPLVGRLIETARRGSMMVTHAMMGFGKDPSA